MISKMVTAVFRNQLKSSRGDFFVFYAPCIAHATKKEKGYMVLTFEKTMWSK